MSFFISLLLCFLFSFYCQSVRIITNPLIISGIYLTIDADNRLIIGDDTFIVSLLFVSFPGGLFDKYVVIRF